jgi:hypothetical protein
LLAVLRRRVAVAVAGLCVWSLCCTGRTPLWLGTSTAAAAAAANVLEVVGHQLVVVGVAKLQGQVLG